MVCSCYTQFGPLSLIKSVIGDEKSRLYSILMAGLAGGEARTLSYLLRPPGAVEGKISPDLHLHNQTRCALSLSSLGEDLKLFLQSIHGLVRIFKHPKLSRDFKKNMEIHGWILFANIREQLFAFTI